jgi:hypothetical protein
LLSLQRLVARGKRNSSRRRDRAKLVGNGKAWKQMTAGAGQNNVDRISVPFGLHAILCSASESSVDNAMHAVLADKLPHSQLQREGTVRSSTVLPHLQQRASRRADSRNRKRAKTRLPSSRIAHGLAYKAEQRWKTSSIAGRTATHVTATNCSAFGASNLCWLPQRDAPRCLWHRLFPETPERHLPPRCSVVGSIAKHSPPAVDPETAMRQVRCSCPRREGDAPVPANRTSTMEP